MLGVFREWVESQGSAGELESGEGVENSRTQGQGLACSGSRRTCNAPYATVIEPLAEL